MSPTVRSNARWAGLKVLRVPDAVQRSSRCAAEPGPTCTLNFMGPGSAAHRLRAALRPGHERSSELLMKQRPQPVRLERHRRKANAGGICERIAECCGHRIVRSFSYRFGAH